MFYTVAMSLIQLTQGQLCVQDSFFLSGLFIC